MIRRDYCHIVASIDNSDICAVHLIMRCSRTSLSISSFAQNMRILPESSLLISPVSFVGSGFHGMDKICAGLAGISVEGLYVILGAKVDS